VIHNLRNILVILICCFVLFVGCSGKKKSTSESSKSPTYPVTCIGVLPAVSGVDLDGTASPEQVKALRQGTSVMNRLLKQELAGLENITFITVDHLAGLQMSGGEKPLEYARMIGESIGCNAILETTVWRYTERIGGKYTAEAPSSVAFDSRLIGIDQSAVIWSAKFDEVQVSVLENIYDWGKANTRGFSWISAEELMLEGLKEKLENSPYFMKKGIPSESTGYDERV